MSSFPPASGPDDFVAARASDDSFAGANYSPEKIPASSEVSSLSELLIELSSWSRVAEHNGDLHARIASALAMDELGRDASAAGVDGAAEWSGHHEPMGERQGRQPAQELQDRITELETAAASLRESLEEAADWLDADLAHAPDVATGQADRELVVRWRAALDAT